MNHQHELDPAEQRIFESMSALLERAGLEYRGNYLEVDGRRIHYLDYGNGPPLLLLHGGGAGSAIWFRQIEALARTRRVIAPDHPVFGLSSQEPYQSPLTGSLLRYLTGFMDALGLDRVDAVGLSMGAQAALAMALAGTGRLNRLVVIDGAGLGKATALIFKLAIVPLLGRLVLRPNRWGRDHFFKTMEVVNSDFEDAGAYRRYSYDVTLANGHRGALRSSLSVFTSFSGQRSVFTDEELRSITNPMLVIWGARDKLFPVAHGYRLAQLAPNATMHVIENSAHVPLLDNPGQVNDLIVGFLGDSGRRG
ncbi:MAG: alpha/beta fold hydrolase [Chloroflexi bacterium]|nr:alpha/beta fold hydrolase [Chloroflexota bacterium]MCI0834323.1 alpha/beta fold hydrolase [Chloroflexota bacterium]MCI0837594.1 alpha/beta fold hydrolase [Chloroflexota bacterium]MCI0852253.1 alpha/beta fold hydrolase [Chloroflexota bacterium]MCI0871973.1 alpha/beta fold hydrolase [Chloroflexota bacterium]